MNDESYKLKQEAKLEQFRSVMQVAALALRAAMITNGAAAISLLTFIGNLESNAGLAQMICALKIFVIGVGLSAFATGTSYLAQYKYLQDIKDDLSESKGVYITYLSIALVFLAYTAFIYGGCMAAGGFNERI